MAETAPFAEAQSLLTVEVGEGRYALAASDVAEVIRPPAVTRVPLGPASLLGIANLRGAVMPVVSLHKLLGGERQPSATARVVVVDRGSPVGFVIDRVASFGSNGDSDSAADFIDLDSLLAREFSQFTRRVQNRRISEARKPQDATIAPDEVALVCFTAAGQDFALPLSSVHEIVAPPADVAAVPDAETIMLGVMSLRGRLLPLVSLSGLLGLRADTASDAKSRVVVAQIGETLIGFMTDGMKEILRVAPDEIDAVPAILTRGISEAKVQGICRLEGDRRLVSILSTDSLFRDRTLAEHIAPHMENNPAMNSVERSSESDEQFIVFRLGDEEYGLPIASVDEVVRVPETLSRVPKAPAFIEGVMNLRGRVVPVIDQRLRFNFEGGERQRGRIVVVTIDHMQAGFIVDAVSEVLKVPQSQIRSTPDLAADESQVIDRIANIEVDGRMILLLNPRELLDRAEKDLLAAMRDEHVEHPAP